MMYCLVSPVVGVSPDMSTMAGSVSMSSASSWTSLSTVAENSRVCLVSGMCSIMKSKSSSNPMSSMRSASSRTTSLTWERSKASLSIMSLSLPGVPTMMSAPLLRA